MLIFLLMRSNKTKTIVIVTFVFLRAYKSLIVGLSIFLLIIVLHWLLIIDFIEIWSLLDLFQLKYIIVIGELIFLIGSLHSMTYGNFLSLVETLAKSSRLEVNGDVCCLLSSDF